MSRIIGAMSIAVIALFQVPAALAQQTPTVGDILTRGGKKLAKEEVQRLLADATVSGQQADNVSTTFQNKHKADGTISGDAWRNGQWQRNYSGRWNVTDDGRSCIDLTNNFHSCVVYFAIANKFYAATSDSPAAAAYERQITR